MNASEAGGVSAGERLMFGALDVGGTTLKAAVFDDTGTLLAEHSFPTTEPASEAILAAARAIKDDEPRIAGLGVVCPGIIDETRGVVVYASNLALRDWPMREALEEAVGIPVKICHDGRAAGLAEMHLGAGRGYESMAMIPIGTGISAALCYRGELWRGHTFCAGEIGHAPIFPHGEECKCGQRGCLEVYASAKGIARRYAAATGEDIGTKAVQARLGVDPAADEVWETATLALGLALTHMTLAFDPQAFVIGGGLSKAGDVFFEPVRAQLAAHLKWRGAPEVVPAQLGAHAGRWGAAIIGCQAAGSDAYLSWEVAS